MPGVEWTVPSSLTTPEGTLALEDGATLDGYVHDPVNCDVGLTVRSTVQNVPQGDGDLVHARWKSGYVLKLVWQLWDAGAIALGATRREMYEELMLHLNAIANADGRYQWTPSGASDRIVDGLRLLEWPDPTVATNPLKQVAVTLDTRYPYAIDAAQTVVTVGASTVVTNDGNVPFYPVIKVYGAFTAFTLTNETVLDDDGNPLQIVYDSTLPGAEAVGAGHYAEITTFGGGKVYLDGAGDNLKKGIDVLSSEFFPLAPGANTITLTGAASADFLVNGAYAL